MDACVCMGASIGMAMGMEKARGEEFAAKMVAVIGDSTFVHSGITPLIDTVYNQGTSTVLILDNDTTAMTGHQDHPATGVTIKRAPQKLDIEALVRAVGIDNVQWLIMKLDELEAAIREELERREPSVIIAKRACALIDPTPITSTLFVDEELCNGCKACIRIGCTEFSLTMMRKAAINPNTCVSCGMCVQVCKFDAIKVVEG